MNANMHIQNMHGNTYIKIEHTQYIVNIMDKCMAQFVSPVHLFRISLFINCMPVENIFWDPDSASLRFPVFTKMSFNCKEDQLLNG